MSSEELFMTCKENSLTITNIPTEIINNCNNSVSYTHLRAHET